VDARTDEDAGAYVLSVSSASTASLFQNQLIYPDIRRDEDAGAYVLSVSSASTASLFQNQLIYPDIRRISIGIYEVPWGPFPGPTIRESTTAICELSEPSEKLQYMPGCVNSIWNILSQAVSPVRLLLQVYVQYLSPLH
jgi:hypothetical protein